MAEQTKKKELKAVNTGNWSYVINENGNAMRVTLQGYGSCTPANVLQEWMDNLTPEEFEEEWESCEKAKDVID